MAAIVSGIATAEIAKSILAFIEKEKLDKPYPCKAIYPPIKQDSNDWHDYFDDCEARKPYSYLNGGVWPFLGGFYVAALVKVGEYAKAEQVLVKLAEAKINWQNRI